jgi:hypothetical protein
MSYKNVLIIKHLNASGVKYIALPQVQSHKIFGLLFFLSLNDLTVAFAARLSVKCLRLVI